jgi:hypothetical protein
MKDRDVAQQLVELRSAAAEHARQDGYIAFVRGSQTSSMP